MAKVAILYQEIEPPVIDGIRKPGKPTGYADSGADIAYALRARGHDVVTPVPTPNPSTDKDWVFGDSIDGIGQALAKKPQILWLNTVLFSEHPLLGVGAAEVRAVAQVPKMVQIYEDKYFVNKAVAHRCNVAQSFLVQAGDRENRPADALELPELLEKSQSRELRFPSVVKPVRGRGSQGVKVVDDAKSLAAHIRFLTGSKTIVNGRALDTYGDAVIVEEFLPGREITITVMPPGTYSIDSRVVIKRQHWCLPPVERIDHVDRIAPYSGVVEVSGNSHLISTSEWRPGKLERIESDCAFVAAFVEATAPVRIDCRENEAQDILLFDINFKPNMTGPGRPGRELQDGLSSIAADGIGWSYTDLLEAMLSQAVPLSALAQ